MALSAAEKQRRYRRHRAGDHSQCAPERECRAAATSAPEEPMEAPPPKVAELTFGARGQELWDAMVDVEMGPAHRVLLVEACRLADRLDRFDQVLSGGYWFFAKLADEASGESERVEIVIDNVLSEARQYASALKAIVNELESKPSAARTKSAPVKKATGVADLAARIQARRGAAG